jgi:nucleoside-diphosphate-sugar epimerase
VRIFLAGATGVIGRRLTPLLIAAGHTVVGTTRSADKADELQSTGVEPVVVDAFDADSLLEFVAWARPDAIIHQLTDLPDVLDPNGRNEALMRNARLRIEGTANLVAASLAAGTRQLVAQSIAFAYADGPEPHRESDALASAEGDGPGAITARGVRMLEHAVLNTPGIAGIVLRYGRLYGPGTWSEAASGRAPLHVDAAAHAALLAVTRGRLGIYNIAEDDGAVSIEAARKELGFDPAFRV